MIKRNYDSPVTLTTAFVLANGAHVDQKRKHSIVDPPPPYISHLMEVAGMVLANGGSYEVAAAALLHDILEDQGKEYAQEILDHCGPCVLSLVRECTEIGTGIKGAKAPWKQRKEAYIAHINAVSQEALLIMIADKLQNARELLRACKESDEGYVGTISKFGGGYQGQKWFHMQLIDVIGDKLPLRERNEHVGTYHLYRELSFIVYDLFSL